MSEDAYETIVRSGKSNAHWIATDWQNQGEVLLSDGKVWFTQTLSTGDMVTRNMTLAEWEEIPEDQRISTAPKTSAKSVVELRRAASKAKAAAVFKFKHKNKPIEKVV